jgi:membrane protease YdiL (CAAX protease family)
MRRKDSMMTVALLFEGALVVVAIAAGWLLGAPALADLRIDVGSLGQGILATLPILLLISPLARRNRSLDNLRDFVTRQILPIFKDASLPQLALLSALAGLGEEALFRGVLQTWLAQHLGTGAGWVLASVAFGLAHYINRTYAIIATLIGLYLGWLYLATGNLLVPAIAHGLYDFVALLVLLHEGRRKISPSRTRSE